MKRFMCNMTALILCFSLFTGCAETAPETDIALSGAANTTAAASPTEDTFSGTTAPTQIENPMDSIKPNQYGAVSVDKLLEISGYSRQTDKGVELIDFDNRYTSGYLLYTITSARVATSVEEMQCPPDGFLLEACYSEEKVDGYSLVLDMPPFVQDDGSFRDGYCVVLVDITVESRNAAMRTGEMIDYDDPYLFRADSLITLVDLEDDQGDYPGANYSYKDIRYFSEKDQFPEHETAFRLEPGETIDCTVGYILNAESYGGTIDFSRFRACTSSGHPDSALVDLNLGSN